MRLTAAIVSILLVSAFVRADDEDKDRVPKLVEKLKSKEVKDRRVAASELASLGPEAKTALPNILAAMKKDADA